jgi:SAM-dependent methyltransferase
MGSSAVQGELWGRAARDWAQFNEPSCEPFYQAVFDSVGLTEGHRLLDAGCGSGLALQFAAKRGATVTGLDASAGLLEIARERVPDGDIRQGDIEELPFPDNTFDVVTAFNSVQYAADPIMALRELGRVAKTGAPVAVLTWGAAQDCETRAIMAAIGSLLPPPPPGAAGPFALSEPGRLERLASSAGLTPDYVGDVPTPFIYPDLDTALRAQLSSGPALRAIEHAGEPVTRDALAGAFAGSRRADGSYRQDNSFHFLVARA